MPQEQKNNTTFEVTFDAEGLPVCEIAATQVKVDERYIPGYIQLWDENSRAVAYLRMNRVLMIRRLDSSPHAQNKPGTASTAGERPSPKQLAELAGRGGKPGDV